MKSFEELQSRVETGDISVVHIEAVPRSVSTAFARSLNEGENNSIFINEPFNRRQFDIDAASKSILDTVDNDANLKNEPIVVLTKNMARNLDESLFEEWTAVCSGIVWCIRDPLVQIDSLLTRTANDLANGAGTDFLTREEVEQSRDAASSFLENSAKSTNFSKTSWADIGAHFKLKKSDEQCLAVDGDVFTYNSESVLKGVCKGLRLTYSPCMITGWTRRFINANTGYNPDLTDETHAWTKEAATSSGILQVKREPLDLDALPPALREHIQEVAMPVYEDMMSRSLLIDTYRA